MQTNSNVTPVAMETEPDNTKTSTMIEHPTFKKYEEGHRQQILAAVNREKSMLQKLPPTSSYVIHRFKVVNRVISLLMSEETSSSGPAVAIEVNELNQLLASLSL